MGTLDIISDISWKQPFKNRKKEFKLWRIPSSIVAFCKLQDRSNYKMNILFEEQFNLDITGEFHITSGQEIYFRKKLRERIKPIRLNNPNSFFTVTILDQDKGMKPKQWKKK